MNERPEFCTIWIKKKIGDWEPCLFRGGTNFKIVFFFKKKLSGTSLPYVSPIKSKFRRAELPRHTIWLGLDEAPTGPALWIKRTPTAPFSSTHQQVERTGTRAIERPLGRRISAMMHTSGDFPRVEGWRLSVTAWYRRLECGPDGEVTGTRCETTVVRRYIYLTVGPKRLHVSAFDVTSVGNRHLPACARTTITAIVAATAAVALLFIYIDACPRHRFVS